jgi:hypothetical protein
MRGLASNMLSVRLSPLLAALVVLPPQLDAVMLAPGASAVIAKHHAVSPIPAHGSLMGISCTASSSCWALGIYGKGLETLHWDGAVWRLVPSPISERNAPLGDALAQPLRFTCSGKESCWAIGVGRPGTIIAHWNGRAWSRSPAPDPDGYDASRSTRPGTRLTGIACASSASCWAVGDFTANTGPFSGSTLGRILHWNGVTWANVPTPLPGTGGNSYDSELYAVGCAGSRACWAVGTTTPNAEMITSDTGMSTTNLILRWNGVRWSPVQAPHPNGAQYALLSTVACASRKACWSLGSWSRDSSSIRERAEALFWNGRSWSPVHTPAPRTSVIEELDALSCGSATDCWAVGIRGKDEVARRLVYHWNGHRWSRTGGMFSKGTYLDDVSLPAAADGWAIGSDPAHEQDIFHWDGDNWASVRQHPVPAAPARVQR